MSAIALAPTSALAQSAPPKPLPFIVFDVRVARASMGTDPATAEALGIEADELPGGGLAFSAGVHTYPFRRQGFAIGLGAEGVLAHAKKTGGTDSNGNIAPDLARRFEGISGVLSLNFGGRDGWSYLSGGLGPLRFETTSSLVSHGTAPATTTPNVGGGARWFVKPHMAAGFDVRLYLTQSAATTAVSAGRDRMRVIIFAAGITLR